MKLIARLSPEITIKTRPVRRQFSQRLQANIRRLLARWGVDAEIVLHWDMLELICKEDKQAEKLVANLRDVPGIAHFLEVAEIRIPQLVDENHGAEALERIADQVVEATAGQLDDRTFVVRCKRSGRHNFTSHDVERHVGARLLAASRDSAVKLVGADITVTLQIKQERLFIVHRRHEGAGGYPLGCVAPVLSLVSGGFDSSVATYQVIRRGMEPHFCFFNLGGHAHEVGVKQVSHYLWERFAASHRTVFISVPFEEVVEEILDSINSSYRGVILKRMMYRAATQIASEMSIDVLVTGESVSQVSSQTPKNLSVIENATDKLVLRPLSCWDKVDIIHRADAIGITPLAAHMPEYCAVISDKPTTAAKMHIVEGEEKKFDFDVLERAIAKRRAVAMDKIYMQDLVFDDIEVQSVPQPDQVVIDLRTLEERENKPLELHGNELIHIPFYKLNSLFSSLDPGRDYLLYCDRGVMSKMHAVHLRAEGYDNIKVYQPSQL